MKRLWWLALLLWSAVALALPTVDQVQAEVVAGRYEQAESMMREVVAAKPRSARAHYVYAELLAHDGKLAQAAQEAQQARTLDPAIGFTEPQKFRAFEQKLQQAQAQAQAPRAVPQAVPSRPVAPSPPSTNDTGIPGWVWPIGAMVLVVLLWRAFVRPRVASGPGMSLGGAGPMGYRSGAYPGGYSGGYGAGYAGGGSRGSGLVGTGLAAAGGVAAGMLIEKMLEGEHHHPETARDVSGLQPGMFDDAGNAFSGDVDFGSGGGDWGGDAGGSDGGGGDFGGSGGDW